MDASAFNDSPFGAPTRQPGTRWAFTYYLPKPIPRDLTLSPQVVAALSEADSGLGHLQGLGMLIPDPSLLIGPYVRREAVASSRIEGTQASLSDLYRSEVDTAAANDETAEVQRYLAATRRAHDLAQDLPITQRLILDVHATLLEGVRGEEKSPGEYRRSPVWIGDHGSTLETAVFVPPIPEHLPELLSDWERFVNDDGRTLPALVQAALMHYQFETIHPFLDGNGRVGRLLISVLLHARNRLTHPLLYLSHYFESHRSQYYDRLQAVRETGDIEGWLLFFLHAVKVQADDAVERSRNLIRIREEYHAEAIKERSNLAGLVDILLRNPFVTVKSVERELGLTNQGARNLVRRAESRGWLSSIGAQGRGGRQYWYAPELFRIIEMPMQYESTQD